eukprot:SAG11_NODE_258_length_11542_cov_35.970899_3_plen_101_part_00
MASLFGNAVFDISSAIWILGCVVLDLGAGETVAMALPLEWHGVRRWVEQPFAGACSAFCLSGPISLNSPCPHTTFSYIIIVCRAGCGADWAAFGPIDSQQ